MTRRPLRPLLPFLPLLLVGCPTGPKLPPLETLAACRAEADKGLEAATKARADKDVSAAEDQAELAEAIVGRGKELATPGDEAQEKEIQALLLCARRTRRQAKGAAEEKELSGKLDGLVAKGYRKGSAVALEGLFLGLAKAADEASKRDLNELPDPAKRSAEMAAELATKVSGRKKLEDGAHDWAGISSDMQQLAETPSPRLHLTLALAFLALKRDKLALYELSAVDTKLLGSDKERFAHQALTCVVYRMNGYVVLAGEEAQRSAEACEGSDEFGPEVVTGIYLFLAGYYLHQKEYRKADEYLVRAIRAWPNNPISVFLTGERLLQDGKIEEAKESFEKAAQGTDSEWLSQEIAGRVRAIRDGEDTGESLLTDTTFIRRVAFHYVTLAAKRSPQAKELEHQIEYARAFGAQVLEKLREEIPGIESGEGEDAKSEDAKSEAKSEDAKSEDAKSEETKNEPAKSE